MPKPCPEGKIRNPATGRCVKKSGVIGKKLLAAKKSAKKPKTPAPKSVKKPKTPAPKSVKKPKTPAPKSAKKSGTTKSFKLYVMLDGKTSSAVVKGFQKHLIVSSWKDQMGYIGLKDIKVKLEKTHSNYVVLNVTLSAEKFEMKYFDSLKRVMGESVSEKIGVRSYMSKQPFMK